VNNSKASLEMEKFQVNWTTLWNEEQFREKTYLQIIKDFSLAGLEINSDKLKQNITLEELAAYLEIQIANDPRPQLLYIIDLKEEQYSNLGFAIVQRIAFKVYLRLHFSQSH
tara:strand:- start:7608 stop:7943 length:336 start_codon:yes stop_codon:yes gene_type:complete